MGFIQILYATPIQDDYELTDDVVKGVIEGWVLYKKGKTICQFNGGVYADQNLEFGGNQFWTNGNYARYDRDHNGHHETVFLIVGNGLEYFGSIGSFDQFVHVSNKHQGYLNQSFAKFISRYGEKRKQNHPMDIGSIEQDGELNTPSEKNKIVGNAALGKRKTAVCAACHMADGNSVNPLWPKLAGQHASYLVKQLKDFKSKARKDPIMQGQVPSLSEEDMYNLAAYYSSVSRKVDAAPLDERLSSRGKIIYEKGIAEISTSGCIECHGPTGSGDIARGSPLLAGQHAPYIEKQLKQFRYAAQHSGGISSYSRSNDANQQMRRVIKRMTDSEIREVAYYIQGLKPDL